MGDSDIEWTDKTWPITVGCERTAPKGSKQSGCGDASGGGCYAERTAARFCGPGQPAWTDIPRHQLADYVRFVAAVRRIGGTRG